MYDVKELYRINGLAILSVSDDDGVTHLSIGGDGIMFNPEYAEVITRGILSKLGYGFNRISLIDQTPDNSKNRWHSYRIELD